MRGVKEIKIPLGNLETRSVDSYDVNRFQQIWHQKHKYNIITLSQWKNVISVLAFSVNGIQSLLLVSIQNSLVGQEMVQNEQLKCLMFTLVMC